MMNLKRTFLLLLVTILSTMFATFPDVYADETPQGEAVPVSKAISFEGEDVNGENISLQDFSGNKVLVFFFTTWCAVCQQELSMLSEHYYELQEEGIELIAVNATAEESSIEDVKQHTASLNMPIVLDHGGKIAASYGVQGIPTAFAIDENQEIVTRFFGPINKQALDKAWKE